MARQLLPRKKKKRDANAIETIKSIRELAPVQRLAIDALLNSVTRSDALRKLEAAGVRVDRSTLHRWMKLPAFIRAWKLREQAIAALVTKDTVIVNAGNLLEEALRERPVLHRGEDTGFTEIELGHALTANEQLGKAIGAFGQNQDGKTTIVIDIDFSGRKNPVQEIAVRDGEIVEGEFTEVEHGQFPNEPMPEEVSSQPRPTGSGLAVSKPEGYTEQGALIEEPDWLR